MTPRPASLVRSAPAAALLLAASTLGSSCRVNSYSEPPRVVGTGLVRGHAALGIRDEDQLLRLRVSLNPDRVVDLSVWKLLRLEVGLLGASVGVGPIDLGLGALLYDPDVPRMMHRSDEDGDEEPHDEGWEDDDYGDSHKDGGGDDDDGGAPEPAEAGEVGADRWR